MKLKIIISIVVATALSSQAYAMQITKGKLISHREWATKGVKASFGISTRTRKDMKLDDNPNIIPSANFAETHSVLAKVGQPVSVKNDGFVTIANTTNHTRTYQIFMRICADAITSGNVECLNYENEISLEPGGSYVDAPVPTLTITYNEPGTYSSYAMTWYYGSNQSADEDGRSLSDATIVVS
jgi:hypothetical protein